MRRRPPRPPRTDTLFPYTTLFRSPACTANLEASSAGMTRRTLCRQSLFRVGPEADTGLKPVHPRLVIGAEGIAQRGALATITTEVQIVRYIADAYRQGAGAAANPIQCGDLVKHALPFPLPTGIDPSTPAIVTTNEGYK